MEVPVRDYAERNPHAGHEGLIQRFGTPEQIVESYLDDMDVKELSEQLNVRKKIVAIVGAAALAIVLLWACVVSFALVEHFGNAEGYFGEEVITITDREEE